MKWLYDICEITKQGYRQGINRESLKKPCTSESSVIKLAKAVRKLHLPGSGARPIYQFIRSHPEYDHQLQGWGKHRFEKLCLGHGLRVVSRRYVPKTTVRGDYIYPNLIEGMTIYDVNIIWVSDICYIYGNGKNLIGYATSVIDLYSRHLLGLRFSRTMQASDTIIPAIKQTFETRNKPRYAQTFFHSDGGKQYIAKGFKDLIHPKGISSSMARNCYENPFAESFNDVLKNHMIYDIKIGSFSTLKKQEKFIKKVYNYNKTHSGIGGTTPISFELAMNKVKPEDRKGLEIKIIN